MSDDLQARFLARFLDTAVKRLARARELAAPQRREMNKLSMELHALAGEASMLDLTELADIARTTEATALQWAAGTEGSEARCFDLLRILDEKVATLVRG